MRLLVLCLCLTGCIGTSTGIRAPWSLNDYPWHLLPTTHVVGVLKTPQVSMERYEKCNADAAEHFLENFNMTLDFRGPIEWERPGQWSWNIWRDMGQRPVPPPLHRLIAQVHANAGDFAWDTAQHFRPGLGSIYGWVDWIRLVGYAFVEFKGANHAYASVMANGLGVCGGYIHELEHMFGCGHGVTKTACYEAIWWTKMHTSPGMTPGHYISHHPKKRPAAICTTQKDCDRHRFIIQGKHPSFIDTAFKGLYPEDAP